MLDRPGPADFARVAGAELGAVDGRLGNGGGDLVVGMAEQQRPVATEEVDIFVAVDVPFMRALGMGDVGAVGVKMAGVMGDAGGQQVLRLA